MRMCDFSEEENLYLSDFIVQTEKCADIYLDKYTTFINECYYSI